MHEVLVAALESDLLEHLLHLRMDLRDLAQAHGVYLRGRQVGGGVLPHLECVVGLAVGQRLRGDAGAAMRQIVMVEVLRELPVRRRDFLGDRRLGRGAQPRLLACGNDVRHLLEGLVERTARRIGDNIGGDLVRHALHHHLRLRHPVRDPLLEKRDRLIHVWLEALQTMEEVAVISRVLEAQRVRQRPQGLDAVQLIDRHQVVFERVIFHPHLVAVLEQVVADPILAAERARGRWRRGPRAPERLPDARGREW